MSDWLFDDGSAAYLLAQDYSALSGAWSEGGTLPSQTSWFASGSSTYRSQDDDDVTDLSGIDIWGSLVAGFSSGGTSGGGAGELTTLDAEIDSQPSEPEPPCTDAPDGPTPSGVNMDELRKKARDLANDAAGRDDEVEWGGLIWADASGGLHVTRLATSGNDEMAAFALGDVAPGGRIVATFHTHPERSDGVRQDVLNPDDRDIVRDLQAAIDERGMDVTIDPKAMMYVTDNARGETKEFDVNDSVNSAGVTLGPCGSN